MTVTILLESPTHPPSSVGCCGSCRHWLLTIYDRRPPKPDTTWGQCALVGLYGPTTNALARILNTDRRPAALQTHRDYGCVQWEAA